MSPLLFETTSDVRAINVGTHRGNNALKTEKCATSRRCPKNGCLLRWISAPWKKSEWGHLSSS